ncbi:6-bladed beta-propeller protein [Chitinophaga sp. YR627]|uniref:6-bladed beta-propeller n=1 Tax=Chitinophaga sp. YR627 TaxID=1881041 RepID=UPI0008E67437|nr:6-bladed beta-propeller [Chitinophaga sp. YR627]SFM58240.1 6-bladed beta-propeller protein [Chitinophaga sp. YR627]
MKHIYQLISIIFLVLVIAACNGSLSRNRYRGFESVIDVNKITSLKPSLRGQVLDVRIPPSDSLTFDHNSRLTDIKYVRLETTPESKIGLLEKLIITGDRIIVADFSVSKSVFVFDSTGHFISRISANKGTASRKAMISNFIDIAYDFERNEIILHDQSEAKSYYFDKDANFLHSEKEYVYFYHFANLKNTDQYVYLNQFGANEHIPGLAGSTLYLGTRGTKLNFTTKDAVPGMIGDLNFYININLSFNNSNDNIFYTPEFSDTVYQIGVDPIAIFPKLVIHYPGPDINSKLKELHKENLADYMKLLSQNQYYSFKGEVLGNNDSTYYIGTYRDNFYGYFLSARTGNIIGGPVSSTFSVKDSLDLDGFKYPLTTYKDHFVSILGFSDFSLSKSLPSSKLAAVRGTIKESDNPVLLFYKIKAF